MVTFPRIPTVATGDRVTHTEMVALAEAIDARILSGLGDPTARIGYYLAAMQRQIRNPSADGNLWPPVDEMRTVYEHFAPSDYTWPFTAPGEPEGTNVSSTLVTFVFGSAAIDLDSEDLRLTDPVESGGVDLDAGTGTPREIWELAKRQRGAFDPTTGAVASPAFRAAQSHFAIIQSARSIHGNAYGGYQPVPERLGDCADGDSENEPTPWVQLIFTPLIDGLPTLTFEGFCPEEPTHVARVIYLPNDRYRIIQYNGTVTDLLWTEYVEGPYTFGNRLTKTFGNHAQRVLNHFVSEFRGTTDQVAAQLAGQSRWLSAVFPIHEFLVTQYHLAPQAGVDQGDGSVAPEYPQWTISGSTVYPSGTAATQRRLGANHATPAGCLTTAVLLHAQELLGETTVDIREGSEVIQSVTLTSDPETQRASQIVILDTPRRFTALNFQLSKRTQFASAGSTAGLLIEATDLYEYKPGLHDLSLLLRLGGARIELQNGTDGSGTDEDQAAEIGDDYFANGCLLNRRGNASLPGSFTEINSNAVFDAARRMSRRCSRVLPRENLVGYEVAGGKSILYFRRLWHGHDAADVWEGIGPAREPATTIQWGRTYIVTGSTGQTVTYATQTYSVGQTFTGLRGETGWSGTGSVLEADGILDAAPPQGWSNAWVLDVTALIPYSNADGSTWKVDAYTDYVGNFFDRCTFRHPASRPAALTNHFAYGEKTWIAPESLPAFRYAEGINRINCAGGDTACEAARRQALRSCPVGHLPHRIESVTAYTQDGEERIKVVLADRLQHGSDAPATIDPDLSTWDWATIQTEIESGRTHENGIREYLLDQFVGGGLTCTGQGTQPGNAAHNSTVHLEPDAPNGACYPRISLTRLMPIPYVPVEGDPADAATPMESWPFAIAELYARAMCEGYVDGVTTERYGCETGVYAVLDLSFEAACLQAFGGRAFGVLPSATTTLASAGMIRADKPLFHGPLPNTYPCAEVFNQFAGFFNLLTDVRLMLPLQFQTQTGDTEDIELATLQDADGTDVSCTTGQVNPGAFTKINPHLPAAPVLGSWSDDTVAHAGYILALDNDACDGSGSWRVRHIRTDEQLRWSLVHSDWLEAVPVEWQDMIESNGLLLGIRETQTVYQLVKQVGVGLGDACNSLADFWSGAGVQLAFPQTTDYVSECKLLAQSERLVAPLPPRCAVGVGRVLSGGDLIQCPINATGDVTVTPIEADALVIRVALVDP